MGTIRTPLLPEKTSARSTNPSPGSPVGFVSSGSSVSALSSRSVATAGAEAGVAGGASALTAAMANSARSRPGAVVALLARVMNAFLRSLDAWPVEKFGPFRSGATGAVVSEPDVDADHEHRPEVGLDVVGEFLLVPVVIADHFVCNAGRQRSGHAPATDQCIARLELRNHDEGQLGERHGGG